MSAHKDHQPPPLPDKQVLETYSFVEPVTFAAGLVGMGYSERAKEICELVDKYFARRYLPCLIEWPFGGYCFVAFYSPPDTDTFPNELNDTLLNELVMEAYRKYRSTEPAALPVLIYPLNTKDDKTSTGGY